MTNRIGRSVSAEDDQAAAQRKSCGTAASSIGPLFLSGGNSYSAETVVRKLKHLTSFSLFYRTQVYLGSDLWVRVSLRLCADLTDVTLAYEDTNSILTDNFGTNASDVT